MGLSDDADIATLGRRENISLVFIKTNESGLDKVVIPVRGFGLWGTMYGYLALESDLSTIAGLGFINTKRLPDSVAKWTTRNGNKVGRAFSCSIRTVGLR